MTRIAVFLFATALAGALPRGAAAQTGAELVSQGLTAYRGLDYAAAIALIRRGLAAPDALSDTAVAAAYTYLGAAEVLRGRPGAAVAAFRQALANDPTHRPDTLIFPPQVTNAFEDTRLATAYVTLQAPRDTTIDPGTDRYPVVLLTSAPHEVTVTLVREGGATARLLYGGPVRDSLTVRWDGLDEAGDLVTGAVAVQVASPAGSGGPRVVRLPIDVRTVPRDTLPHPARPVAGATGSFDVRRLGPLAGGLLTGVAVVALPSLVAHDGNGEPARYAVGVALGLGGVIGFVSQRPRATTPPSERMLQAWREELERVRAENARRQRDHHLRVRSGTVTMAEDGR